MKRIIVLFLAVITLLSCVACGKVEDEPKNMEPQVSQMKAICELAVMECYYHNVAKYTKEDAEGILWWKQDKHFWIEYSGKVSLGIEVSLVSIEIVDNQITITIPEAKVLECKVDSSTLNPDSFIVDKDSAKAESSDAIEALALAQADLEEIAAGDKTLLDRAQQQAQALLEDYINNIGEAVGKTYDIKWVYLDANGNPTGSKNVDTNTPAEEPTT